MKNRIFLLLLVALFSYPLLGMTESAAKDGIAEFTSGMEKQEGYFIFYYDDETGKIYLQVDKVDQEFLYVNSLTAGIGSNDIGLDRGQLDGERVVRFEKFGNKLLLIQPNQDYRAVSDNQAEVTSVAEAFASSAIGGFEIKAQDKDVYLIEMTDFLLRDSHGVASTLKRSNQGSFSLDKSRSAIYMDATFNFPKNTEFESLLTFSGEATGWWLRSVTPSSDAVTVRTHHSFIELPDDDYTPRVFDPRSGFFNISYQDYATPIDEPLMKRFIVRHRLKKKDPSAAVSEPIEPIIYYVDRGAPEPVRSALIDGASWWNQAFEAAGYKDAFQVKVMPEGAHPMDIRYNVIQWVHRSTRGWSYGSGVTDPRTGEMIKGHVSLGSLRVRQDFLIATGLLQPYETGDEKPNAMTEMALARLRQLSAHEVGHTIGLAHNFAASTNDRASVMDYPHPYVKIDEQGNIDLSEAYDDKIGAWDKVTIKYGYSDFPGGENEKMLGEILDSAFLISKLKFITDQDARPLNGMHPHAHLWDNGTNPAAELNRMLKVRRKVLDDFSLAAIPNGTPLSSLEEVLVPVYLLHRYQLEAASKVIGGKSYSYALRGSLTIPNSTPSDLEKEWQIEALDAMLKSVAVENLSLSGEILRIIPPRAFGFPRSRETFQSKMGPGFDPYAVAETAANLTFMALFNADRFNRLAEQYSRRPELQLGVEETLGKVITSVWKASSSNLSERSIQQVVEMEMLRHLMGLAVDDNAYDEVRAKALAAIQEISSYVLKKSISGKSANSDAAYYAYVTRTINHFFDDPSEYKKPSPIKAPDGSPIGSCDL